MSINVAINGYGRIGRCLARAIFELGYQDQINLVAINDLSGIQTSAHLTQYDTTHGTFRKNVDIDGNYLVIDGHKVLITANRNPKSLPWQDLNIDVVLDCTGRFTDGEKAKEHLDSGAKKVLISAPGKNVDKTIVYGINHQQLSANDRIVSNASCTTNCLAPIAKPLNDALGIESGLMNTIHAYTKDQMLIDGNHKDLRRARAAAHSIIPTKTGAAIAVGLVLPELAGKLDGFATRVPTLNVSVIDLTFKASRKTSVEEVNEILANAANNELKDVLAINHDPLVSCDFNHNPASSIFDATQTKVIGDLVKVLAWYDNEWGFSCRMLDTTIAMMSF
jgi:glyceraldehyde 3-phosphate dehydrogenase